MQSWLNNRFLEMVFDLRLHFLKILISFLCTKMVWLSLYLYQSATIFMYNNYFDNVKIYL